MLRQYMSVTVFLKVVGIKTLELDYLTFLPIAPKDACFFVTLYAYLVIILVQFMIS